MYQMPNPMQRLWMRIKWPMLDLIHKSGMGKGLLRMRFGARIIIYHGIDAAGSTKWNSRFISETLLETQLRWLSENCNVLSLDDYWKGVFDRDRLNVCITFDDGYRNNFTRALPLLLKYRLPAAFFITPIHSQGYDMLWPDLLDLGTAFVNDRVGIGGMTFRKNRRGILAEAKVGKPLREWAREGDWNFIQQIYRAVLPFTEFRSDPAMEDYWKLMNEQEIRELAGAPGVTIGTHGLRHCRLGKIGAEAASFELKQSKTILENITGKTVDAIAFPDGNYTREVVELSADAGYRYMLASDFFFPADEQDNRMRERFGMNPHISWSNQLYALLRGRYI